MISSSHYAINVRAFWTELIQWYHILCMLHWHLTDMLVTNVPVCQYESSCCQRVNLWLVKLMTVMSAYRQFAEWMILTSAIRNLLVILCCQRVDHRHRWLELSASWFVWKLTFCFGKLTFWQLGMSATLPSTLLLFIYFENAAAAVDSSRMTAHPLHGVSSVYLQILLMGMCWQCGSWSVAGHTHRKVIGRDPICAI